MAKRGKAERSPDVTPAAMVTATTEAGAAGIATPAEAQEFAVEFDLVINGGAYWRKGERITREDAGAHFDRWLELGAIRGVSED